MQAGAVRFRRSHTRLLAALVIVLARWAAHSALAARYSGLAALALLWVVSDAMMLALMASTPDHRPGARAVLGTLAGAVALAWISAPSPLRQAIVALPLLPACMIAVVIAHFAAGVGSAGRSWRSSRGYRISQRLEQAAGELVPPWLIRVARAELQTARIALFDWRGQPDVPPGCVAFTYHRHLAPQMWVLLSLMAIEAAAEHILIQHWSPVVGTVLTVLGDVSLVYLVGLVKSLRLRPVLLTEDGVRVRMGILIDHFVSYRDIAGLRTALSGDDVRASTTWNMALLAWPNIMIDLQEPVVRGGWSPRRRCVRSFAIRLDEPAEFIHRLEWHLATRQARL